MNADKLRKIFDEVRRGQVSPDEGVELLRHLPFEDLDFAKLDHHRALRVGMPEVILGQGKTPVQVGEIFARLARHSKNVLATRATKEQFAAVKKKVRGAEYRELARAVALRRERTNYGKGTIAVVSAGTSDVPVAEEAVVTAELMGNNVEHFCWHTGRRWRERGW
jgi:NCAIR mutase (PurE)-related protein